MAEMGSVRLFFRIFLRPLGNEPFRTGLTAFAVALGVAVVLAIRLAGEAAAGSFQSSLETLAGDADFEVTAPGGVPDEILTRLSALPYPLQAWPRIEDYAVLADSSETVPLLGIDMIADAGPAAGKTESFSDVAGGDSVWVTANLARKADRITLLLNDHVDTFTVRGVLAERPGSFEGGSAIVMDIALAMRELGRAGRLDRILIRVPRSRSLVEWQSILTKALPPSVKVARQGARTNENRRMLQAFRWNLRVLSYIALIVGAFLIYNTIAVSVVRRRAEIGILRAVGASRGMILTGFLGDAAAFGLAGTVLGTLLGRLMATGTVKLIASTVESLYVSSRPAPVTLSVGALAEAALIGLGATVISALSPAIEAASISPVAAMARGRAEHDTRVHKARYLTVAGFFGLAAFFLSRLPAVRGKPVFGYASALLLVGCCAFSIPAIAGTVASGASRVARLLTVESFLACRGLGASLRRTSVLVAALSTAIAMMVSVGIMVGSFRQTVLIWMQEQLQADLYLRPAGPEAPDRHPTMAPELAEEISALPGVAAVGWLRSYTISYEGLPATLAGVNTRVASRFGRRVFVSGEDAAKIFDQLGRGDFVILSEPFANKHHLHAGNSMSLALGDRPHTFRVLGVYYDYGDERGYVVMDRATLLKFLPDPAPSNLAVYVRSGVSLDEVRKSINRISDGHKILIQSNQALRREAMRIFDRTFAITYALEAIAVTVAVMGVAGALLAIVIDRRRELALLRFMGASSQQVRRFILSEAGLLGLMANLAGFVLGVLLSLILIFVINKQSFGWTIRFHWPVAVLLAGLSLVYLATIAAGLYPARVAAHLVPIEVIHEE